MKKILIVTGRYLPGYKDGGPVRTLKNLTDYLGDEYEFRILTCDRDHGDTEPYPDIKVHDWNRVGKANVYYVPPKGFSRKLIKYLANDVDLVYVCGCFNDYAINTLLLNRFGQIQKPVVVAAMGLFSPLGFRLKYKKKKLFTTVFNLTGMFKNIYWSATSEMEITQIKQHIKTRNEQIFVAEDLPRMVDRAPIQKEKREGVLEMVWISRITPHKNLLGAIKVLQQVKGTVHFTIYGPIHEEEYWQACQDELQRLPENITWVYKGNVESEKVVETLRPHHVFLLLTLSENYGHVIQEALSAGCPCLISDQTPWRDFEEHNVGYVFPLDQHQLFAEAIERYIAMPQEQFDTYVNGTLAYVADYSDKKVESTGYRTIFDTLAQ